MKNLLIFCLMMSMINTLVVGLDEMELKPRTKKGLKSRTEADLTKLENEISVNEDPVNEKINREEYLNTWASPHADRLPFPDCISIADPTLLEKMATHCSNRSNYNLLNDLECRNGCDEAIISCCDLLLDDMEEVQQFGIKVFVSLMKDLYRPTLLDDNNLNAEERKKRLASLRNYFEIKKSLITYFKTLLKERKQMDERRRKALNNLISSVSYSFEVLKWSFSTSGVRSESATEFLDVAMILLSACKEINVTREEIINELKEPEAVD